MILVRSLVEFMLKKRLPKITKKQMAMERELADWFQLDSYEERHK